MALSTQPYKGARDFYPPDKRLQKYMFGVMRRVAESFGYQEYDVPLLEPLDIYAAKSGEEIVNEQLYSFADRGGRQLAIRPEMTPSVSRMVAGRRQELAYPLRLYSIPNLWRYERPQRGRLREHWQLNVDLFGVEGLAADHEIILVAEAIMQAFGAPAGSYTIKVNSRKLVDAILKDYVSSKEQIQEVAKLLDKREKMPETEFEKKLGELITADKSQELVKILSQPLAELPEKYKSLPSARGISQLLDMFQKDGVTSVQDDRNIMRGFDYYTDIVFEVYDNTPDNNRSMFGGGRYDGLVGLFGVEPLPTVGFGMGDVTLQNFLEGHSLVPQLKPETQAVVILVGDVYEVAQKILRQLRQAGLNIAVDSTDRKLDSKIKNAAKSGVKYAIFLGQQELDSHKFRLKDLESGEEQELSLDELLKALT